MNAEDVAAIRARVAERARHFHVIKVTPSGMDEGKLLKAAHADVEALLAELERGADPDACPFCASGGAAIVEDVDGSLVLCKSCGGRGPSCATVVEARAAWQRRGRGTRWWPP